MKKETSWISTKKRLPKKNGNYLVWLKNNQAYIKRFSDGDFYRKTGETDLTYIGDYVRYWQPIPSSPE